MSGVVVLSDRVVVAVDADHEPAGAWDVPHTVRELNGVRWGVVDADALAVVLLEATAIAHSPLVIVDRGGCGFVPGEVFSAIVAAGLEVEIIDDMNGNVCLYTERRRPVAKRLEFQICHVPGLDVDGNWTRACAIAACHLRARRAEALAVLGRLAARV